jgi:hypothetical protein
MPVFPYFKIRQMPPSIEAKLQIAAIDGEFPVGAGLE